MKSKMFLALMFGALILWPSLGGADDGVWQRLNPAYYMNQVKSIDVGYTQLDQKLIFAAEGAADGKIWISDDNCASWGDAGLLVDDHGFCKVFVQKSNLQYAWALAEGNDRNDILAGPYYYNGSGPRWDHRISGIGNNMRLFCMAVDYNSTDLQRVLVGGGDDEGSGAFFFLTTNGVDWNPPDWIDCDDWPIPPMILPENFVQDIAFAPNNSQIVYFIMNSEENVSNSRGLFKSTDGGQTWSCSNFWGVSYPDMDADFYYPYALAVDPNDANRVAVSVCCGIPSPPWIPRQRIAKILISTEDNGQRDWQELYVQPDNDHICNSLAFSSDGSSLYAAFVSRLNLFNRPEETFVVRIDGTTPHQLPNPNSEQPGDKRSLCVALDPLDNANVYVGTEHVVYSSSNYGDDVHPSVDEANVITAIAKVDAEMPNLFFMTDDPPIGSIYRSTDYGQNWFLRRDGWSIINSTCIQGDPSEPGLMFAACTNKAWDPDIFSSIQKSTDFGETWSVPAGWFIQNPFFIPGKAGTIKCLAADTSNDPLYHHSIYFGVSGGAAGLYYSATSGSYPVQFANYSPPDADPLDIAIHPTQSATIVVADGNNGLYRTTNHYDFSPINGDLPVTSASKFKYCPGLPTMALAATPDGIYKSIDVNLSSPHWSQVNTSGDVIDMDFHPTDNSIVCFCANGTTSTNFYISADSARSWLSLSLGYDGHNFSDLSIDVNNPDTFYAATDAGIYKLKNPVKSGYVGVGETWGPGTVIVNGDITILDGVNLTIAAGTDVKILYNFDKLGVGSDVTKSEIGILGGGTLTALGTQSEPITFESSSAADGRWYGIVVNAAGNLVMDYCTVKDAIYGVYAFKPINFQIHHSAIKNNLTEGIYIAAVTDNPHPDYAIDHSRIENNGNHGIYCHGNTNITIQMDTIVQNNYGVYYWGDLIPQIEDCVITHIAGGQTYYGIYVSKGTTTAHPIVRGDSISGFAQAGIYFNGAIGPDSIINTEIISSGLYGILYSNSSTPIASRNYTRNLIQGNMNGVYLQYSSSPSIRRTRFKLNTYRGVSVGSGCAPNLGSGTPPEQQGYNSFIQNPSPPPGYRHLDNCLNITPVPAKYNYWTPSNPIYICNADYNPMLGFDPLPLPRRAPPNVEIPIPNTISLVKAYPNPFNPTTTISFNLGSPDFTTVRIYNITGQFVSTVFEGQGRIGENTVIWDGRNNFGVPVSTGVYFCLIRTEYEQATVKLTMLK